MRRVSFGVTQNNTGTRETERERRSIPLGQFEIDIWWTERERITKREKRSYQREGEEKENVNKVRERKGGKLEREREREQVFGDVREREREREMNSRQPTSESQGKRLKGGKRKSEYSSKRGRV